MAIRLSRQKERVIVSLEKQRETIMPDIFMEDDPWFQEIAARSAAYARSKAKGRIEGKLEIISPIIKLRFPDTAGEVQQKAQHIQNPEMLDILAVFIATAPDEKTFLWALDAL